MITWYYKCNAMTFQYFEMSFGILTTSYFLPKLPPPIECLYAEMASALMPSTQQWQLQHVWQMDQHQLTYRTISNSIRSTWFWHGKQLFFIDLRSSHLALSDSISFNVWTVKMSHIIEHFQTHFENRQYFTWWNHCWNPSYLTHSYRRKWEYKGLFTLRF